MQGMLARGDRRLGEVILLAHQLGGRKYWKQALKQSGIAEAEYLYRQRTQQEVFPWDNIDVGVTRTYLWAELERALQEAVTPVCFDGCRRCGVCSG